MAQDPTEGAGDKQKWKRLEALVAKLQRDFASNATVEQNVKLEGRITGVPRQIDVAVRVRTGQFELLIVIDCKDYGAKVDVKDVEEFLGLVQDVGANHGALVTTSGYTPAALKRAENAGLRLFKLVDAESTDWPQIVEIPVLARVLTPAFAYSISTSELREVRPDFWKEPVLRDDGSPIGSLAGIVGRLWNEDAIPKTLGEHKMKPVPPTGEATFFRTDDGLARVELGVRVLVRQALYSGSLRLRKIAGFRDEMKGTLHTKSLETEEIDIDQIQKTWTLIEDEDQQPNRPVLSVTFVRAAGDPDSNGEKPGSPE